MPQANLERWTAQAAYRGAARTLFISGDTIGAFFTPRRRARWPRARRCSSRRSRAATGRSGRACTGGRGSPLPSRSKASTGPTLRSPTAGAATSAGRRTRPAARRRGQGEAPGPGRVRLRALRRGRDEASVPGHIGQLREEECDIHRQRRVQQVGHGLRRRQARVGHLRPRVHLGRLVEFGGLSHGLEESLKLGKSGCGGVGASVTKPEKICAQTENQA